MIGTATRTWTQIRVQLITFQLKVVNELTTSDPLLERIIEYSIPEEVLSGIYLKGTRNDEVYARMDITMDVEKHTYTIDLKGNSVPTQFAQLDSKTDCPVWREAIEWFARLVGEKGLTLGWAVSFQDRCEEMRQRFALQPDVRQDQTAGAPSHHIPHSFVPELNAAATFSATMWPE